MNNRQHVELAFLLVYGGLEVELIAWEGGPYGLCHYEYSVFQPKVQQLMTGCKDLDDFDGIHQIEEDTYVGNGESLGEAFKVWDSSNADFTELFNNPEVVSGTELSKYLEILKERHEL